MRAHALFCWRTPCRAHMLRVCYASVRYAAMRRFRALMMMLFRCLSRSSLAADIIDATPFATLAAPITPHAAISTIAAAMPLLSFSIRV